MPNRWTPALAMALYIMALYACAMGLCWCFFRAAGVM